MSLTMRVHSTMQPPAPRPAPAYKRSLAPAQPSQSSSRDACDGNGKRPSTRRTTFGSVHILKHEQQLDGSKLPSDGRAPIGLGKLAGVELRHVISYEEERQQARKAPSQGRNVYPHPVRAIPSEERLKQVALLHSVESISAVEDEILTIKRQRLESVYGPNDGLDYQSGSRPDGCMPQPQEDKPSYHSISWFDASSLDGQGGQGQQGFPSASMSELFT